MSRKEAWRESSSTKITKAIRKVVNWEVELQNPELVLELLLNIQRKLDWVGYSPIDRY